MPAATETISTSPAADADVRCLRCEYNLRGLDRAGKCPECGEAIESSWMKHELQRAQGWTPLHLASPLFLRRMGWGCVLLLASAGMIAGTMLSSIFTAGTGLRIPITIVTWAAAAALLPGGLWLLGTREASQVQKRRQSSLRWIIRAGAVGQLLDSAYNFSFGFMGKTFVLNTYRIEMINYVIAAAIFTWAAHLRLTSLMKRSDAPRGVYHAETLLAWLWPPLMVLQGFAFASIPYRSGAAWLVRPDPVIGQIQGGIVFMHGLLKTDLIALANLDSTVIFWSIAVALTLTTLMLLGLVARVFFSAARRGFDGKVV